MKLTKRIELPNSPYIFEVSLESKTTEAHSLMSDNQNNLLLILGDLVLDGFTYQLKVMSQKHLEKTGAKPNV